MTRNRCNMLGQTRLTRTLKFEHLEDRRVLAGMPQIIDLDSTPVGSQPSGFFQLGESIYFTAIDFDTGRELYRMDSPQSPPELVADLVAGVTNSISNWAGVVNNRFVFSTFRASDGYKLWSVTEGDAPLQIGHFTNSLGLGTQSVVFGSDLYFVADNGTSGLGIWRTNGTLGSVSKLADLDAGHGTPNYFTIFNSELIFAGRSGSGPSQLWKLSLAGGAPISIANTYPGGIANEIPILGELNGELYFSAETTGLGRELWKTNGTVGGAVLVKDIWGGSSGSSPGMITVMNGIGYFTARASATQGFELWRTDGTGAGTYLVVDLTDRVNTSTVPNHMTVWNDRLYFGGSANYTGEYLYSSDGTAEGTAPVKYVGASQTLYGPRFISSLQVFDNKLIFEVDDQTDELWSSDGTEGGTQRISQYVYGDHFGIGEVTAIGDLLYMNAGGNVTGTGAELWTSDGTADGTAFYFDINQGTLDGHVN